MVVARAGEVLPNAWSARFRWDSHALTPGHIEPRRGRPSKVFGVGFRGFFAGVGPALSDQTKDAAGEGSSQLLAALDGGAGRRPRVR